MSTVPPRPDSAPDASCPTCGLPGEGVIHDTRGIHTANYLCPAGHIWLTRWTEVA